MTQEEKWKKNYAEVVEYMDMYHRNPYQAYRKFVNGKKGIVYAINREHARHIAGFPDKR